MLKPDSIRNFWMCGACGLRVLAGTRVDALVDENKSFDGLHNWTLHSTANEILGYSLLVRTSTAGLLLFLVVQIWRKATYGILALIAFVLLLFTGIFLLFIVVSSADNAGRWSVIPVKEVRSTGPAHGAVHRYRLLTSTV